MSSPMYTNKNNDRQTSFQMYQELDWLLIEFKKEYNISYDDITVMEMLYLFSNVDGFCDGDKKCVVIG